MQEHTVKSRAHASNLKESLAIIGELRKSLHRALARAKVPTPSNPFTSHNRKNKAFFYSYFAFSTREWAWRRCANTVVIKLNTAVIKLNTAVIKLNTTVGKLNTAVFNVNTAMI